MVQKRKMPLKFYSTVASPPSLAVQQCLTYLGIPFELEDLLYTSGRHMSEEFAKVKYILAQFKLSFYGKFPDLQ